eukprot:PDM67571.1 hypothetical protein PRIPAC_48988 [Pristionchus pacificus]
MVAFYNCHTQLIDVFESMAYFFVNLIFMRIPGAWIYLTPIAVILIFILPLPLCWHLLISPAYYSDVSNGIGMNYVKIINYFNGFKMFKVLPFLQ